MNQTAGSSLPSQHMSSNSCKQPPQRASPPRTFCERIQNICELLRRCEASAITVRSRRSQGWMGCTGATECYVFARCLNGYCERVGILPEAQIGFRQNRSTTDMMFAIRRLQELARKKRFHLYVCFIDFATAHDSVDRTFLWAILARFGLPQNIISVIR